MGNTPAAKGKNDPAENGKKKQKNEAKKKLISSIDWHFFLAFISLLCALLNFLTLLNLVLKKMMCYFNLLCLKNTRSFAFYLCAFVTNV